MTFIPLLTITFIKIDKDEEPQDFDCPMYHIYNAMLQFPVRNRIVTLSVVATLITLLFIAVMYSLLFRVKFK